MAVEIKHSFERPPEDYYNPVHFPALGFDGEHCHSLGDIVVYEWEFAHGRIVMWRQKQSNGKIDYALNLYRKTRTDKSATHYEDRYDKSQGPIVVADALEAQMMIFHLLQKYNLPCEVTHEENT